MKNNRFVIPEAEIVNFTIEDIITSSNTDVLDPSFFDEGDVPSH